MAKRLNTSEFIEKCKIVHNNFYNYNKSKYINSLIKLIITCPFHGEFQQLPKVHLRGGGCTKCKSKTLHDLKAFSLLEFIEKANKIHNKKYDYSLVNYVNNTTKIIIICPIHGKLKQIPHYHLSSIGCKKCGFNNIAESKKMSKQDFITKCIKLHGDKYNYDFVKYKNNYTNIKIVCPKHGEFQQTPSNHLFGQGCNLCGNELAGKKQSLNIDDIIKRANTIHNNQYTYKILNFKNIQSKIEIFCKKCNYTTKTTIASILYNKTRCKQCSLKSKSLKNQLNSSGWKHTDWVKSANISKNFDSFKLYIIKCWNDEEEFYKIGRTFVTIKNRCKDLPYLWSVYKIIEADSKTIYKLEQTLKNKFKKLKHTPKIKFAGSGECFNINLIKYE